MNDRLDNLVQHIRGGGDSAAIGPLSTGERCYVALGSDRYDLLSAAYADPIEAWQRLDTRWRLAVCKWRGWPENYAVGD